MVGAALTHKTQFFGQTLQGSIVICATMAERPVIGCSISDQYNCGNIRTTSAGSTLIAFYSTVVRVGRAPMMQAGGGQGPARLHAYPDLER